ncbi:nucleoside deaminase [bacterium]|nr:nucleoside deaminase [bacterium]
MAETDNDIGFMREAIEEARVAGSMGEVPVGCVVSRGGSIIARAHNLRENRNDPTAHAEVLALRAAGAVVGSRRLEGTTIYVTLEPCPMCMAAIMLAGVRRLVFGAKDPEFGAAYSHWNMPHDPVFKHDILVTAGIESTACSVLLADFFESRRA